MIIFFVHTTREQEKTASHAISRLKNAYEGNDDKKIEQDYWDGRIWRILRPFLRGDICGLAGFSFVSKDHA